MKKIFLLTILVWIISITSHTQETPQRKVLHEYFSTQACGNCPAQTAIWKEVMAETDNLIWVTHHAGYGTDIFTISESQDYLWFYGGSTFAPGSMLDRTNMSGYGGALVAGPKNKSTLKYYIQKLSEVSPSVTVNIDKTYNEDSRLLSLAVSGDVLAELPDNPRLNIFITENGLAASQSGGSDNYVHDRVMRYVLSDVWGDEITFENDTYSKTYSFTVPDEGLLGETDVMVNIAENMEIVAFVSNYDSNNRNNCKVLNAESTTLVGTSVGIENKTFAKNNIRLYVSGQTLIIAGNYRSAEIFDIAGNRVMSLNGNQKEVTLKRSIYIVRMLLENGKYVTKKVVVR